MEKMKCPYCGGEKFHLYEKSEYECEECGCLFDEGDIEVEGIRHEVSALLNGTSEEEPRECEIMEIGEDEACGLSSLELPMIDKAFEVEGEGTIWFHIYGEEDYRNFDEFSLSDLRKILAGLR